MSDAARSPRLERTLARLLEVGTWLATAVIAAGVIARSLRPDASSAGLLTAGIGLIIALPVVRLVVMLVGFSAARSYRFAAFSALVLAIVVLGFWLGRGD